MTLQELLISNGIEEAIATKILDDMKTNKIYTSSHENIDVRYSKLKEKVEGLTGQLDEATTTLEGFKAHNPEKLQADFAKLKGDYEALQGESAKKLKSQAIDFCIKDMLKENKAKSKYADLLQSKIDKESLHLNDKGEVEGLQDVFKGLRDEYADLFEQAAPALGGMPPANNGNSSSENSALFETIRSNINRGL